MFTITHHGEELHSQHGQGLRRGRPRLGRAREPGLGRADDPVNINTAGNTFQFGTGCAPGMAPLDGNLNWRENAALTSTAPLLTGDICLQNTNATVRVAVEHYDAVTHALITRNASLPLNGNGGPLNTSTVSVGTSPILTPPGGHVHVQLERQTAAGWVPIAGAVEIINY